MQRALERARARRADEGFTLIELLIVIVILGILAAIVIFSVSGITSKGDTAACKSQVASIDTAYEAAVAQGQTAKAVNIEDLYGLKMDGTTAGLGLLHGTAPTKNTIDGNDFSGGVAISAVDTYTCK